ncbi:hypothetical protein [uncultured Ruminococcus sp.]
MAMPNSSEPCHVCLGKPAADSLSYLHPQNREQIILQSIESGD